MPLGLDQITSLAASLLTHALCLLLLGSCLRQSRAVTDEDVPPVLEVSLVELSLAAEDTRTPGAAGESEDGASAPEIAAIQQAPDTPQPDLAPEQPTTPAPQQPVESPRETAREPEPQPVPETEIITAAAPEPHVPVPPTPPPESKPKPKPPEPPPPEPEPTPEPEQPPPPAPTPAPPPPPEPEPLEPATPKPPQDPPRPETDTTPVKEPAPQPEKQSQPVTESDGRQRPPETEAAGDTSLRQDAPAGGGGGGASHIDGAPLPVRAIRPVYPLAARRAGQEGTVVLDVMVTARGTVEQVRVVDSSGHAALDGAALRAARQARFQPAQRDGQATAATARVTLVFRLREL